MVQKKRGLPEESEIVICTVTKVLHNSVFATLDEYEKREGLIHISEIAPGRIRNIRDYVKEGKRIVCKVIAVNRMNNQIDISLRRVSLQQRLAKEAELKQEKIATKMLEAVAKNLNILPTIAMERIGVKLSQVYGTLFNGLRESAQKDIPALEKLGLTKKEAEATFAIIKDRLKPPEVSLTVTLFVTSAAPDGVTVVKKILGYGRDAASEAKQQITFHYLGSGRFQINLTAPDFKKAEKTLEQISEVLLKEAKKANAEARIEREK